jgi:choloylglycine hydrolase
MGGLGLPGDSSSVSRFVRAAFTRQNAKHHVEEAASLGQFFHILETVKQIEGCVNVKGKLEKTVYSSCCNLDKGIYYYTTYENSQITAIDLHKENLDSKALILYPLITGQQIYLQNKKEEVV